MLLSDEDLFRVYKQAKELNLDKEFIFMLEKEIKKRDPSFFRNPSKKEGIHRHNQSKKPSDLYNPKAF